MADRLALFTGGQFADSHAKTAHGILRYGPREVVCVVDATQAGGVASDVVPYVRRPAPIVAGVADAAALGANVLVIGVAPFGGALTDEWRAALLEAIAAGMDVEAGLHTVLAEDPELSQAAARAGVRLRDLRAAPPDLSVPTGDRPDVRVVHTVGSDCAIGKMSVTLELDAAARARGLESAFVATGQTGIAIAGWGIAVDAVVADFLAGAAEQLVVEGARRGGKILFVEGQGSLVHPMYSGVTLGLVHGAAPHLLVLCHSAGATEIEGSPGHPIPPLSELVELHERIALPARKAKVACIALNTAGIADDEEARAAIASVVGETGLPADDPVRFGAQHLLDALLARL